MTQPIQFWFEFASTYSYLAAMRVDEMAKARGVEVAWRPFLLGPIFHAQGWDTSPFVIYPAKGKNMWRDFERRCKQRGLPWRDPQEGLIDLFPQNSLLAARLTLVGLKEGWGRDFARAVYQAQFGEGRDISTGEALSPLIEASGGTADSALAAAGSPEIKSQLRTNVEEAIALGVYGAPSFTVGEELFWGDDRLEDALAWAVVTR